MIGDFGYTAKTFGFEKLSKNLGIEVDIRTSGKYKMRNNPFEPQKEEDKKFFEDILVQREKILLDTLANLRKLKPESIEEMKSKTLILPKEAVDYGLADGIKTLDEYLKENNLESVKFVDYSKGYFGLPTSFSLENYFSH